MATLISNASGNLTGAATFVRAGAEGSGTISLARADVTTLAAASSVSSANMQVATGAVIDGVLLWVMQSQAGSTGTFKVDLQKGGVSQGSVTVNKTDLPALVANASIGPVFFKFGTTATGDNGTNWNLVLTTTGTGTVSYARHTTSSATFMTRALRTTTAATPAAGDDLYITGELTGAGTHNSITVTMDSTATTAYGSGVLNSTSFAGGGIHISNYGTLTYGTSASTNYVLRVNGDVMVYQFGTLNIPSTAGSPAPTLSPPLDGLSPTAAWSASRKLLTAYGGAFYTPTGTPTTVSAFLDQSGNSRDLTPPVSNGPLIGATSPISFLYNGAGAANTFLNSGALTASSFISNTAAYMIVSMQVSAFTTNTTYYANAQILQDNGQNYGLTVGGTGSSGTVYADTYSPFVSVSGIALNTPYVLEFRIDSGTLYLRVNGGGEVSVGASTAQGMGVLNLGGKYLSNCHDGYIWEAATFNTVPTLAQRDAMAANFLAYAKGATSTSTAVLEFQQASADGDFGLRCLDYSTVTITGQPRTAGKNVSKCKLTANVVGSNVLTGGANNINGGTAFGVTEATNNSLLALVFTDNSTSGSHSSYFNGPSINNTTQTATMWLARGNGTNNRYVRVYVGDNATATSITNGFYSDIDLQAGTAGTVTAVGTGTATSVSIVAEGRGYLIRMTGKLGSSSLNPNVHMCACAVAGTISYVGNSTQCFIFDHVSLVTASSISNTTFNVDADTGWLSGDAVCVASTTRNVNESEIYPLNANAGASSFTSALYPFGITGNAFNGTHSGTSPTQGEVGLLTRNVKIRSISTTLMSYVYCTALATVTASWAEFHQLGTNIASKRGIEIEAGATTNPKNFSYCSAHDFEYGGFWCANGSTTSMNVTLSNNIIWKTGGGGGAITLNGNITNTDWTFDGNLIIQFTGVTAIWLGDVGGVCTNNTVVGIGNSQPAIMLQESNVAIGTFNNNTVHSCAGWALQNNSTNLSGVINNFSAWRCNDYGVYNNAGTCPDLSFNNLTLFGNNTYNMNTVSDTLVITGTSVIAGDASFAVQYGIRFVQGARALFDISGVDFSGTGTGLAAHTSNEIFFTSANFFTLSGTLNNCKFAASGGPISSKSVWSKSSYLGFEKYSQIAGDHRTEMAYGQLKTDSVVFNTASPSMRMTANSASSKLESAPKGKGIQVAVNSSTAITASVYVRKDSTYTGNQPRLIVRANAAIGINVDTVLATYASSTGTWNQISGTTIGATDDGVMEFIVDCDGTAGFINVDDWAFTASPVSQSLVPSSVYADADTFLAPSVLPPPFNPMSLTGLMGWWDASVFASMTIASGTYVNVIADQSGHGNTMTWIGSGPTVQSPQYITNFNNSYPAMSFNSANSAGMKATSFPIGTGNTLTLFVVGTALQVVNIAYGRICSYAYPGASNDYNNAGSFDFSVNNNSLSVLWFERNTQNSMSAAMSVYPAVHRFIVTVDSSGVMTLYVDGVASPTGTAAGNWISSGTFAIGYNATGGSYWAGPIGELGIATGYHNATTVAQLDSYLAKKWGLDPATNFLARTSGLDTTHVNAYTALINGLVTDGIWSKLDVLRIYATQDTTTALLNLVSSNYTGTLHGSPTFTADRGFTGSEGSSTVYIDSGFNPTTAVTPQFAQAAAHMSVWPINNTGGNPFLGSQSSGSTNNTQMFKYTGDNNLYIRINSDNSLANSGNVNIAGHILGNRVDSGDWTSYRNGTSVSGAASPGASPPNLNFYELGCNVNGTAAGSGNQFTMMSWGTKLSATDATNFYNRLRTYMTAVGVP